MHIELREWSQLGDESANCRVENLSERFDLQVGERFIASLHFQLRRRDGDQIDKDPMLFLLTGSIGRMNQQLYLVSPFPFREPCKFSIIPSESASERHIAVVHRESSELRLLDRQRDAKPIRFVGGFHVVIDGEIVAPSRSQIRRGYRELIPHAKNLDAVGLVQIFCLSELAIEV